MKNQTTEQFLEQLRGLDVKLWSEGDGLRYKAPENVLTSHLLTQIRERKPEILAFLQQAQKNVRPALPPLVKIKRDGELPLSFAQQRLWFLAQFESESSAYNMSRAFHLKGELNLTALEQSFQEIIRHHEVLRTVFPTVEGQPIQVILPDIPFKLLVSNAEGIPREKWNSEIQQWLTDESQEIFDLSEGTLLSVKLLRLATTEHIMLLNVHHIVSDGWSMGIFMEELSTLYPAFVNNIPPSLPPLPIQYVDFALWQRQWLTGEVLENQISYWFQQLIHLPPTLELPIDKSRPALQTFSGSHQSFVLSKQLTQKIKALCRQEEVTLFMGLLTAFSILLLRYSGQENIAIGSPIANRNQKEIETLIGCFVNTLVMGIDLKANPTVSELLKRVKQTTQEAYAHQDLPFEKLVEQLQPERSLRHSPLFQVMFVLQNVPQPPLELVGVNLTPIAIKKATTQFDLTLIINETKEGLKGKLEYNTDLFEAATINRMIGHFQTLLEGIVTNPQSKVTQLPLLTEAEGHQLLVEWNDTQADYPKDKCLHQLFEEQVKRTPDAVAVVFEGQQLTYQELNCRANQLAHYLKKLGVGPEVLVGICVERSLEMVVGLLGILKAGGAYVPLDPAYPKERLAYMVADSQMPVLLAQQHLASLLPAHQAEVVGLDADWETIAREREENPISGATAANLAYVIYTSGSTGKPKGVQIVHQSVINFLYSLAIIPGLTEEDILLAITTISFDIAALELYLPLIVGAKVILASREVAADGSKLRELLETCSATVMQATPATWRMLLTAGWQGNSQLKILCGGEALPQELANQLQGKGASLWNLYGPTEATIWSTVHPVPAQHSADNTQNASESIGRPIANTQIYILDSHLQPVPIGVPGELHIGGVGLARGYRNRPELTAEKFIANPFSQEAGSRLYKTGDLVRYLPNGDLDYLGRLDFQVKVRGFRIELGEIEAALAQHPAVKEAVAIVREDQPGDKRIAAYLTASQQQSPAPVELRRFLQAKIPDYMLPSTFVVLESFPLTPNGKVDRRALPAPDTDRNPQEEGFVAPRQEIEHQLAKIWEKVLGIQPIGIRDNFFHLGGHSLLAVRLFAEIEAEFGRKLPLALLFESPTIEELASVLRPSEQGLTWDSLVLLKAGKSNKQPLFLIHDPDGKIIIYHNLAQCLDSDRPIYGLQPYSQEGFPILHTRIKDMAAHYIEKIRSVQPAGPYLLGGLCAGGVLAFEMAVQLQAQGQQVALVALLDAAEVQAYRNRQLNRHLTRQRLARFSQVLEQSQQFNQLERLNYILAQTLKKIKNFISYESQTRVDKFWNQFRARLYRYYLERNLPVPQFLHNIPIRRILEFEGPSYSPQIYQGPVALFRATEAKVMDDPAIDDTPFIDLIDDPLLGWGPWAKEGVEVHDIPGGHSSMLQEPHVQVLAEKLQTCIERSLSGDAGVRQPLTELVSAR